MLVANPLSKCLICAHRAHFILQAASFYTGPWTVTSRERSGQFSMASQVKRKTKFYNKREKQNFIREETDNRGWNKICGSVCCFQGRQKKAELNSLLCRSQPCISARRTQPHGFSLLPSEVHLCLLEQSCFTGKELKSEDHIRTTLIMSWNVSARNELQAGQGLQTIVRYLIKFRHAAASTPGCLPPFIMVAPGNMLVVKGLSAFPLDTPSFQDSLNLFFFNHTN